MAKSRFMRKWLEDFGLSSDIVEAILDVTRGNLQMLANSDPTSLDSMVQDLNNLQSTAIINAAKALADAPAEADLSKSFKDALDQHDDERKPISELTLRELLTDSLRSKKAIIAAIYRIIDNRHLLAVVSDDIDGRHSIEDVDADQSVMNYTNYLYYRQLPEPYTDGFNNVGVRDLHEAYVQAPVDPLGKVITEGSLWSGYDEEAMLFAFWLYYARGIQQEPILLSNVRDMQNSAYYPFWETAMKKDRLLMARLRSGLIKEVCILDRPSPNSGGGSLSQKQLNFKKAKSSGFNEIKVMIVTHCIIDTPDQRGALISEIFDSDSRVRNMMGNRVNKSGPSSVFAFNLVNASYKYGREAVHMILVHLFNENPELRDQILTYYG